MAITRESLRPRVRLRLDRNVFDMVDKCIAAAQEAGMPPDQINEFRKLVYTSNDYADAWRIVCDWFEVETPIF